MRGRYADFTALQDRAGLDMQHRTELEKPMAYRQVYGGAYSQVQHYACY